MSAQRAAKWFIHSLINNVGRKEKENDNFLTQMDDCLHWEKLRGRNTGREGEIRRWVQEREKESEWGGECKRGSEMGRKSLLWEWSVSRIIPALCSGEPLCSQPLWDYMDLPTSILPNTRTHAHTHRQNICIDTHRFGCGWSSESSSGSQKRNNHVSFT